MDVQFTPLGLIPTIFEVNRGLARGLNFQSVAELMTLNEKQWSERSHEFLNAKIDLYCQECSLSRKEAGMVGLLEKHDLDPDSCISMIGDIHGNDLRLDLTLKALQETNVLDIQFKVNPNSYIVFIGDYADRGKNSLKVLELVMTLKIENPGNVFVIRGNHEDLITSEGRLREYASKDSLYFDYMSNPCNKKQLNRFYESLPVAVYIGQKSENKRQYVQFSHGFAHVFTDPAPLLSSDLAHDHLWVYETKKYSDRIEKIIVAVKLEEWFAKFEERPLSKADKKIILMLSHMDELVKNLRSNGGIRFSDIYWLDLDKQYGYQGGRYNISSKGAKAYLDIISTEKAKVKRCVRGHQGAIFNLENPNLLRQIPPNKAKTQWVATTIDPSNYNDFQFYLQIKIKEKVSDWEELLVCMPLKDDHDAAMKQIYCNQLS